MEINGILLSYTSDIDFCDKYVLLFFIVIWDYICSPLEKHFHSRIYELLYLFIIIL